MNDHNSAPPKNYLIESILITIFCCLPLGIVGIIKASEVNSKHASGDHDGALASSLAAKKWVKYGLIAGIIGLVVMGIFYGFTFKAMLENAGGLEQLQEQIEQQRQ